MCNQVITKYSQCGHEDTDSFPCDKFLDDCECPLLKPQLKENTNDYQPCPDCQDKVHLENALKQIAMDESLKPVPRTAQAPRDPNAPKHYIIMRESFPWCGHFAKYQWTDIEAEGDEHMFMDEQQRGRCYGCAHAMPGVIEKMKERGEWEGNPDPWGERNKINSIPGSAGPAASAPFDPDLLIHLAFRGAQGHDDHQTHESDEEHDTSQAKNKGVSGRPSHHDEEEYDHHSLDDRSESEEYSDDEGKFGYPLPPRHSTDHHRQDYSDSDPEDRLHGSRDASPDFDDEEVPPPDFQTHAPRHEAPGAPDETEDIRKRLGLPAGLSNQQVRSIMARKESEARDAMRQHSTGALDE